MPKFRLSQHTPKERGKPPLKKPENVKIRANQTEKDQAKKLGGMRHPVSGAIDGFKGDYSVGDFLFDSKETTNASISLSMKDITKVTREANEAGKVPALALKMTLLPGTVPSEWVAIPLEKFAELIGDKSV